MTENCKTRSLLGQALAEEPTNTACLSVFDGALFLICLDDATPTREGNENQRPSSGNANVEDLAAFCQLSVWNVRSFRGSSSRDVYQQVVQLWTLVTLA